VGRAVAQRSSARERVLEAAVNLFAEHGVHGTSLQMIADRLEVGKASVYYQFRTKDEIVLAVVRPIFDDLARVVTIASALSSADARRDATLSGVVELCVRHRNIAALFHGDPYVDNLVRTHIEFEQAAETLRDMLIGSDSDTQKRVTISMMTAGIFASTADPYLHDISDAELRCALLTCSQQLLEVASPKR
jgi:AcrR family transcriptional regulator